MPYLFDEPLVLVGEDGAKWGAGENSAFQVDGKVWVNNHAHDIHGRGTDRANYNIIKGLFVAALTFYGKCFTKCDGRPVKLERAQLEEQFYRLHDECIAYRHNFAAHSGAKKLEYVEIALVSPIKYKDKVNFRIYQELYQPDLFWPSKGDISLTQLVEHTRAIAKRKCEYLVEKIEKEEVIPNAEKFWQAK